jgi:hypothetical protein
VHPRPNKIANSNKNEPVVDLKHPLPIHVKAPKAIKNSPAVHPRSMQSVSGGLNTATDNKMRQKQSKMHAQVGLQSVMTAAPTSSRPENFPIFFYSILIFYLVQWDAFHRIVLEKQ